MTMDPSLPGQLLQAARAVADVRQAVTATAHTAGSATVPGWKGGAAVRHLQSLAAVMTEVNRATTAIAILEQGLGNAAAIAGQTVEGEARAAREAAARAAQAAQADPVYGPPWPGATTGYPTY
jgi:hypothetical protein